MTLPKNVFSGKHKLIFIHIPKTGGSSIKKYLFGDITGGHIPIRFIPSDFINSYPSYAFVRNPYTRILSAYNYLIKGGAKTRNDLNYQDVLLRYSSFEDFVCNGLSSYYLDFEHFLPQYYFTHYLGRKIVGNIGKYENFNEDVMKFFNIELDIVNSTGDYEKNILKMYNENTYQIINRLYAEDFALFNYDISVKNTNIMRNYFYKQDYKYLLENVRNLLDNGDLRILETSLICGLEKESYDAIRDSDYISKNIIYFNSLRHLFKEKYIFERRDNRYFYMLSKDKTPPPGGYRNVPDDYIMFFESIKCENKEDLIDKLRELIVYIKKYNYEEGHNYFIQKPYHYEICYKNFNIREPFELLSKIFRLKNPLFNQVNKENMKIKTIDKIKIAFIAGRISDVSSVFFDRCNTVINLPNNIYEKHLIIISKNIDNNNMNYKLFNDFIKSFEEIHILDFIENIKFYFDMNYDIIIFPDIGMLSVTNLYAHLRSAPLQITTWGHSKTSGIDTIDYYFSSKLYEIENAQEHYSEKLIKFEGLGTTYPIKEYSKKNLFKIKEIKSKFVIGCLCTSQKFNQDFIDFIKSFEKYGNIVFLVIENSKFDNFKNVCQVKKGNLQVFINYIYNCQFLIDTYPFGSCNLGFESFMMNKVMLYYPSEFLSGRYILGFYKKMNIDNDILQSNNFEEYRSKIINLAFDKKLRRKLEKTIKNNKYKLFNEKLNINEWHKNLTFLLSETGKRKFSEDLKEKISSFEFK